MLLDHDHGENLGWSSSDVKKGANWTEIIQSWFDENENFIYPNKSNGTTEHYTQVYKTFFSKYIFAFIKIKILDCLG